MAGQTIQVSVLADTKKFSRAMKGLGEQTGLAKLGRMAKTAAKGVATLGAAGLAAGAALGVKAVGAASDLEQSIGGLDAVFKDQAGQMHEWAQAAAETTGLSRNSYNELATAIGTTLKNAGIPMDELGGKTNDLMGLSADLAATFGGPVTQASNAMASALRGEFEPLRQYGVSLNAAAIEARALADSGKANAKELTNQEKALATQALIYEQTTDAQGAFARESNTLAGQQERLKAKLENIAATAGTYLLPVLTTMVAWLSERVGPAFEAVAGWIETKAVPALQAAASWIGEHIVPRLKDLATWINDNVVPAVQQLGEWLLTSAVPALQSAAEWVQANSEWLTPLAIALAAAVAAYMTYVKVLAIWNAAVTAAKAAQTALNLAMKANPIGLIIGLVMGLVAAVVWLWNNNEDFRKAVTKIWNAISSFFSSAIKKIMKWLDSLGKLPGKIATWFGQMKDRAISLLLSLVSWIAYFPARVVAALARLGGDLLSTATKALGKMHQGATRGFQRVLTFVTGMPGRIVRGLGNLGRLLLGAGRSIIDGFIGGIRDGFGKVRETLSGLTDMLPDWKGPPRRDRTILRDAGRLVIDGFTQGLRGAFPSVRRALGELTTQVATTAMPTLTPRVAPELLAPTAGRPRPLGAGEQPVTINVYALADGPEVGRRVHQALRQYQQLNGVRA